MSDVNTVDIDNFIKEHLGLLSKDDRESYTSKLKSHLDLVHGNVIKPYINASYLSHWKSSIENLINERRKNKMLENAKQSMSEESFEALQKFLVSFRIYSIELRKSKKKLEIPAKVISYTFVSKIVYDDSFDTEKIRFCIAHELGHIIMDMLYPEYDIKIKEEDIEFFAHFWACFIIYDKSIFYGSKTKEYKYSSFEDIDKRISKLYEE